MMRHAKRARRLTASFVTVMMLTACSSADVETGATDGQDAPATESPGAVSGTITQVAASRGEFTQFVAAIEAAGLAQLLSSSEPFTVFAPTDAAFAALPAGVLETLLLPGNTRFLRELVAYHIVSGTVLAADLAAGELPTVNGDPITLVIQEAVKLNGANLVEMDVRATNGVIHAIDAVILPPGFDLSRF
jgi:uncharacterized surface protein with fasciclin (FAS1) repeats